ncbi:MAG: hypothetical protein AB9869_21410 [Verrucomicrobiia bacterium]
MPKQTRAEAGASQEDMEQFLKVSRALKTIRDKRLFREEFRTFDEYCRAKWGKSGDEVDRLIAEADLELRMREGNPGLQ